MRGLQLDAEGLDAWRSAAKTRWATVATAGTCFTPRACVSQIFGLLASKILEMCACQPPLLPTDTFRHLSAPSAPPLLAGPCRAQKMPSTASLLSKCLA